MSVKRSSPTRSGSLSDITTQMAEKTERQVTSNKRKQPEQCCDCAQEVQNFRKEIASMLNKFTTTQEDTLKFMRDTIVEFKTNLNEIKTSIDTLNNDQNALKTQLLDMVNTNNDTQKKVKALETELTEIKKTVSTSKLTIHSNEIIMRELEERTIRNKNIILMGIPEHRGSSTDESQSSDEGEVSKIINRVIEKCPKPSRVFRLGKYNHTKDRKIKVCFDSPQVAKSLLRGKEKLPSGIKIISDLTPAQQTYLRDLKDELEQRTKNGENNITIKYIKGIPSIVTKDNTKNL